MEYFFEIWRFEKHIALSEKKPPLVVDKVALSQKVFHFGLNFQKIKSISCAYSLYVDSAQESDLTSILEILAKVNSEIN